MMIMELPTIFYIQIYMNYTISFIKINLSLIATKLKMIFSDVISDIEGIDLYNLDNMRDANHSINTDAL